MSDILTGPDRGPPAFDWRKKAVQLQAELDALALRFSESQNRWQPIETAPVETDVLIGQVPSPMVWAAYRIDDEWYLTGDDVSFLVEPTHWMPLPEAPK